MRKIPAVLIKEKIRKSTELIGFFEKTTIKAEINIRNENKQKKRDINITILAFPNDKENPFRCFFELGSPIGLRYP